MLQLTQAYTTQPVRFLDLWEQHHLYGAPKAHGGALAYHWPPGEGFCVWELAVCWFEREAWVETVLKHPKAPDLELYLTRRLHANV